MGSPPLLRLAKVSEPQTSYDSRPLRHAQQAAPIIRDLIDPDGDEVSESFGAIHLDARNRVKAFVVHSTGGMSSTVVRPRDIFSAALLNGVYAIMLFHNHPSGDPAPSGEDIKVTNQLIEAGQLLGIRVLDHIIIGEDSFASLRERGLM